jgi:hypothetical protein
MASPTKKANWDPQLTATLIQAVAEHGCNATGVRTIVQKHFPHYTESQVTGKISSLKRHGKLDTSLETASIY